MTDSTHSWMGSDGPGADDWVCLVVPGGVPADKMEGTLIDRNDPGNGIDPNPNFRPHEPTPIRPPREDAGWDNVCRGPS